ncbi:transposase [Nonomuraea phyllanthi]|uniref:transposase n=1 Tax=Nonomuraea phyllanthi TaxID=2219224 RepID=UPI0012932722|nr:transposase [Nonomuraea phyllanthi]QFY12547.1 transposase [Nonomuraea phyllanthi]
MHRGDLTNAEWERLLGLLPPVDRRGDRWDEHRMMINGALYQARTGLRWRHLPERFGCWVAIYRHHRHWTANGTWRKLLAAVETAQKNAGRGSRPEHSETAPPRKRTTSDPVLISLRSHLTAIVRQRDL